MRTGRAVAAPLVVAAWVLALGLLLPRLARAQDWSTQGIFSASIGYTDNVAFTPTPGEDPNAPRPEADVFSVLSPGIAVSYATPRTLHRLTYVFTTDLFFTHPEGNTVSNILGLSGRYETTETTNLTLNVGAEQGQLNEVAIGTPPAGQRASFLAPTDNLYFTLTAGQGFEKELSESVTAFQGLAGTIYMPIDLPNGYTLDGTLGITKYWQYDTGTLTAGLGYTQFEVVPPLPEGSPPDTPAPDSEITKQLLPRLTASWVHDYGHYFFHQLDVGVVAATTVEGGSGTLWSPIGLAAVRYIRPEATASLEYSHNAAPNVFLGTNQLIDSVILRIGVPIAGTYFALAGSGGVSVARAIDSEGNLREPSTLWTGDAALLFNPSGGTGNIQLSLRYLIHNQLGNEGTETTSNGVQPTQEVLRNTLLLTFTAAYPDVGTAAAPNAANSLFRPSPSPVTRPLETPGAEEEGEEEEDEENPNAPHGTHTPRPPGPPVPPGGAPP